MQFLYAIGILLIALIVHDAWPGLFWTVVAVCVIATILATVYEFDQRKQLEAQHRDFESLMNRAESDGLLDKALASLDPDALPEEVLYAFIEVLKEHELVASDLSDDALANRMQRWLKDHGYLDFEESHDNSSKPLDLSYCTLSLKLLEDCNEARLKIASDWLDNTQQMADLIVEEHSRTLRRKMYDGLVKDDYGIEYDVGWSKERRHFVSNVLMPALMEEDDSLIFQPELIDQIEERLSDYLDRVIRSGDFTSSVSVDSNEEPIDSTTKGTTSVERLMGQEFERLVCSTLRYHGWSASVTKGSGDQGVDVIAKKGNRTIAIQCKYHLKPVGNKAVQECHAGVEWWNADQGAVVSSSGFTQSGKKLASRLGVVLIHFDNLSDLDSRV